MAPTPEPVAFDPFAPPTAAPIDPFGDGPGAPLAIEAPLGEPVMPLFDPFAPVDPASTLQDDGRRLRLALARAVATALGGRVAVEIGTAGETTFLLTLPIEVDEPAFA